MNETEEFEFALALERERGKKPFTKDDLIKREIYGSLPVAAVRGVKDVLDTGAGFLARLGGKEEQARVRSANAAGQAEFDRATEGMIGPAVARVGGNVAATAPLVGGLGGLVGKVAPKLGQAITTGGFSTGAAPVKLAGKAADMGTRMLGGAIGGGVAAGAINSEDTAMGVAIGGALPPVAKVVGQAGKAVGQVLRGPAQTAAQQAAIKSARAAGYVIPPTQARPTLVNRIIEGMSGKLTTAQNASARNQGVTNKLAARALGLPDDTLLSPQVIKGIKDGAGNAYDMLGQAGQINAGKAYMQALDDIAAPYLQAARGFPNAKPSPVIDLVESLKTSSFDAADAVAMIKQLRSQADDGFRTGNTDIARASAKAAKSIEDAIESSLQAAGNTKLLTDFREARTLYAKALTVEKAYNPTTGSVDARKLGARIAQGKPMTGELKQAGDFANAFKKAVQTPEGMGSLPQTSPLDWALAGGMTAATANPLGMAGLLARPAARSAALSPMVQNRLIQGAPKPNALAFSPELLYRAAPYLASDR